MQGLETGSLQISEEDIDSVKEMIEQQKEIKLVGQIADAMDITLNIDLKTGAIEGNFKYSFEEMGEFYGFNYDWEGRIDGSLDLITDEIKASGSGTRIWTGGEREEATFQMDGLFFFTQARGKAYFEGDVVQEWYAITEEDYS